MKRKLLSVLVALLPVVASAYHAEIDGIYYNFSGDEATVTYGKNTKYSGTVVIPPTVTYNEKTYSVTDIGSSAFDGCSSLTSVTIPNSVTYIGNNAFSGCNSLTSLTIPNSVTRISDFAFSGCSSLASVTIPESVTRIDYGAFFKCSGLTSVNIPNSVTYIYGRTFYNCSSLTSVTIPNSVTDIDMEAFYGCSSLTSVTIGNSVTSIGSSAFSGCSSLISLTIPNSVTYILDGAFSYCSSLTSIKVETGNTKYDSRNDCNAIIETSSNTLISGCQNTIIPNSVTSIGRGAFSACSGLTSITIPEGVTSIGSFAFSDCSSLTSVTIPNSVTSIGNAAFVFCSGLTEVRSFIIEPFDDNGAFDSNTYNDAILYVPLGTIEKYRATNGWKGFKTILELVAAPTASVASGSMVQEGTELFLSCETEGAAIWYTTDGSSPRNENGSRILYDGTPIVITTNVTIKAVAVTLDGAESEVAEFVYIVKGTGIDKLPLDGDVAAPVIYDLNGRWQAVLRRGINIIGNRKVLKK